MKKAFLLTLIIVVAISSSSFAQFVPAYVDTNGLLGWYPFSGNANNAYGTGLNGSVSGAVLMADRFGNASSAYHFDGQYDNITIDTNFFNVGWNTFTISWWMYNDNLDNPYNVNDNQCSFNTIPLNGLAFDHNWGGSGKYGIYVNSNPPAGGWDMIPGAYSNAPITSGSWNHYIFQKVNATTYRWYLNGVLDSTYTSPIPATNYFCKLVLGNIDPAGGTEGVLGALDDYGIWTRLLSSCEIKKLLNSSAYLFIVTQPSTDTITPSATAHFSVVDTGTGNTYQWQVSTGAAFTDLSNTAPYSGVTTGTLTVTGVTTSLYGHQYRCLVSGGDAGCTDTSVNAVLAEPLDLAVSSTIKNKISVTPNPTDGNISIIGSGPVDIQLYNTLGQVVKKAAGTTSISIADLPPAMYLIKLFDAKGGLLYYDRIIKK